MSAPKRKGGSGAHGAAAQASDAPPARGAGSYVLEWVNCGSPYCRTCAPGGQGTHGPYWYHYVWQDGHHRKRYVGKTLPPSATPAPRGRGAHASRRKAPGGAG